MKIYDLGFNNFLEKPSLFSQPSTAAQSGFANGVSPSVLGSGEMTSDIKIRGSFVVNDGTNDRIWIGYLPGKF